LVSKRPNRRDLLCENNKIRLKDLRNRSTAQARGTRSCLNSQSVVRLAVCGRTWPLSLQHRCALLQCGRVLFRLASLGFPWLCRNSSLKWLQSLPFYQNFRISLENKTKHVISIIWLEGINLTLSHLNLTLKHQEKWIK